MYPPSLPLTPVLSPKVKTVEVGEVSFQNSVPVEAVPVVFNLTILLLPSARK